MFLKGIERDQMQLAKVQNYTVYIFYLFCTFYVFCICFVHSVCVLRCFDILPNLSGWGKIALPGTSQFSVGIMPLICKLNSPAPYLLCLALTLWEAVFFLNHLMAGYKATREPPIQSKGHQNYLLPELFKLASSKLFILHCLAFPVETKGLGLSSFLASVFYILTKTLSFS